MRALEYFLYSRYVLQEDKFKQQEALLEEKIQEQAYKIQTLEQQRNIFMFEPDSVDSKRLRSHIIKREAIVRWKGLTF